MSLYKKYLISRNDSFEPSQFPNVMDELKTLKKMLISSGFAYKQDILSSLFRKKCFEADWIMTNPGLNNLINSGSFTTTHLHALYDCSEDNKEFQKQYENFLTKSLSDSEPITIGY